MSNHSATKMAFYVLIIFFNLFNRVSTKEINIEAQLSLSMLNPQNIKNLVFFTDSQTSSEWGIDEFKYFSENGIFTVFLNSEQIFKYLEESSNSHYRSTIVIKTEDFGKWKFNEWVKIILRQ